MGLFLLVVVLLLYFALEFGGSWFIFASDSKNLKYGRHIGKVVNKKEWTGYLGQTIELTVNFGRQTKTFENAKWTLERFNVGDEVQWKKVFWLKDPRGTDNLKLAKEGVLR